MGGQETRGADTILGWGIGTAPGHGAGIGSGAVGCAGKGSAAGSGAWRVLEHGRRFEIIECSSTGRVYRIDMPALSAEEAGLVRAVVERFREDSGSKGKQTGRAVMHAWHAGKREENQAGGARKRIGRPAARAVAHSLEEYCGQRMIVLGAEQKAYLLRVIELLVFGHGPLSVLLEDDALEEIAVIGLGKGRPVHVYHSAHGWMPTNVYFSSAECVRNTVNSLARGLGRRLTLQQPKMNAVLETGSRLNAVIEPVAVSGPAVTIRKFRQKCFTPLDLVENKTVGPEAMALLWLAMQSDCSVLVCGNTGSGKTTTLNALFAFVPAAERIVVTEETPEISLPHRHVLRLACCTELGIGMQGLIINTLRMRPDRVIVGEMRDAEEVGAFMDTLLAGQGKASFGTFHAASASEALARLARLGASELDLPAIDLVVVQKRWTQADAVSGERAELRRVVEVAEVLERDGKAELNFLYSYSHARDRLERVGESVKAGAKMMNTFGLSEGGLKREQRRREAVLKGLLKSKPDMEGLFAELNSGKMKAGGGNRAK